MWNYQADNCMFWLEIQMDSSNRNMADYVRDSEHIPEQKLINEV